LPRGRLGTRWGCGWVWLLAAVALATDGPGLKPPAERVPLIIAHRGSPATMPEETMEGYLVAMEAGADFIELDVCATSDGALVVRHDVFLDLTTDVEVVFPGRNATRMMPDGQVLQDRHFVADFTLAEVKRLGARQALPFRDQSLNDRRFQVPTLDEVLAAAASYSRSAGRRVGVYVETKRPAYHRSRGLALEGAVLEALARHGYGGGGDTFVQSFDTESLKAMKEGGSLANMVRLLTLAECEGPGAMGPAALDELRKLASGVGPDIRCVAPVVPAAECGSEEELCMGRLRDGPGAQSGIVQLYHAHGFLVHPYTIRNEGRYMPLDFSADPFVELER